MRFTIDPELFVRALRLKAGAFGDIGGTPGFHWTGVLVRGTEKL